MDNIKYTPEDKQFSKTTDSDTQNLNTTDKVTWWNLIKQTAGNKTTWIIILGMSVALLGYFSSELFTNKITYDNEGFFKKYKVDRIPDKSSKIDKEFEIHGKLPPAYKAEIYTFPSESPILVNPDKTGVFTQKIALPANYYWVFAKATNNTHDLFYRFYVPTARQQQISQKEYLNGIKMLEQRWTSRKTIYYEPSKVVDLVVQGLIFFLGSIIAALVLGINPLKLGLKFGDFKNWVPITALFILVMLPVFFYVAHGTSFKNSYPSEYQMRESMDIFWIVTFAYLIYFLGWEFIFRGYFLMSLKDRIGILPAILFQMVPFAAMHINKPPLEAFSSIFGGIILGILVIRVRSFWPCVIIHWVLHTSINYFVCSIHYW